MYYIVGTSFSRPLSVQAETITAYTSDTPNGLPEDAFSDILEDGHQNIYLYTTSGWLYNCTGR